MLVLLFSVIVAFAIVSYYKDGLHNCIVHTSMFVSSIALCLGGGWLGDYLEEKAKKKLIQPTPSPKRVCIVFID